MKLLLLTKKVPFPLSDGESIAIGNMVSEMKKQGVVVDLLTFNTTKHYIDTQEMERGLDYFNQITSVSLDNRIKSTDALLNLFSSKSYHIERFNNEEFRCFLCDLLVSNRYDYVQLESIYLAPYIDDIKRNSDAKIILRTHNIEHLIWDRITLNTRNPLKRAYLIIQSGRLKKYEVRQLSKVDMIVPMSSVDEKHILSLSPGVKTYVNPIHLDLKPYISNHNHTQELCFIGSLDWIPNVEGLNWFIEKVMPLVWKQKGELRLNVAGKNAATGFLSNADSRVVYHGKVGSAIDYINQYAIMVVPLLSGSGVRVKILEGMALGKTIVSTSVGIEGIDAVSGIDYILGDDPQELADEIISIIDDKGRQDQIASRARTFIEEHFQSEKNIQKLLKVYKTL